VAARAGRGPITSPAARRRFPRWRRPPRPIPTAWSAGSLRDVAITLTAPGHWLPWGRLPEAVVGGQPQDTAAPGTDVWTYYTAHPEEAAHFARAMSSISAEASTAVLRCWDATRFRRILDVGGSQGILLAGLLDAAPSATGVLFDRPEVVHGARASLARLADRVDVIGGDFLEEVPPAALVAAILRGGRGSQPSARRGRTHARTVTRLRPRVNSS
jgi:hypothetical protein